jgi:hypothetical protein
MFDGPAKPSAGGNAAQNTIPPQRNAMDKSLLTPEQRGRRPRGEIDEN